MASSSHPVSAVSGRRASLASSGQRQASASRLYTAAPSDRNIKFSFPGPTEMGVNDQSLTAAPAGRDGRGELER